MPRSVAWFGSLESLCGTRFRWRTLEAWQNKVSQPSSGTRTWMPTTSRTTVQIVRVHVSLPGTVVHHVCCVDHGCLLRVIPETGGFSRSSIRRAHLQVGGRRQDRDTDCRDILGRSFSRNCDHRQPGLRTRGYLDWRYQYVERKDALERMLTSSVAQDLSLVYILGTLVTRPQHERGRFLSPPHQPPDSTRKPRSSKSTRRTKITTGMSARSLQRSCGPSLLNPQSADGSGVDMFLVVSVSLAHAVLRLAFVLLCCSCSSLLLSLCCAVTVCPPC